MRRLKIVFVLLMAMVSVDVLAVAKVDAAREIAMTAFQKDQVKADLPIADFKIHKTMVWFIGRHFLWRWNPTKATLKRIRILKNPQDQLKSLYIDARKIYVSSDVSLYKLNLAPLKLEKLTPRNKHCAQTLSLTGWKSGTGLVWVCSNSVFGLDLTQKKQELVEIRSFEKRLKDARVAVGERSLWVAQDKRILRFDPVNEAGRLGMKEIYGTSHQIRDLEVEGGVLYASTRFTVLRFDRSDRALAPIPVEGKRKLVMMDLDKDIHSYLFSDKFLEVYSLKKGKSKRVRLPFGKVKKAHLMKMSGSFVGMVLDGKMRLFQLSGRW